MQLEDYLKMQCSIDMCKPGLKKIIPTIDGMNDVLYYHNCPACVYTALRRDCLVTPKIDPNMLREFKQWYDPVFEQEIIPLLSDFVYDVNAYYNHLTAKQKALHWKVRENISGCSNQEDINEYLMQRKYNMFCKCEKQEITDPNKHPKNRCITGPNEEYKYVMGPVVHRLEKIFKKNFKGYCSGRSWEDRERILNTRHKMGMRQTIQGDGSGFDRTQFFELKFIEMRIYAWLADNNKITHVQPHVFLKHALEQFVTIEAKSIIKNGKSTEFYRLGKVVKEGGVQSGNCDTTFGNTMRMACYNRFIFEHMLCKDRDAYDLDAAGDDFGVYVPPDWDIGEIERAYYKVFAGSKSGLADWKTAEHGLGQILKFLKVSDIEGTDFCSTETFYCKGCNSYRITRKLDRFLTLTPWSHSALAMSAEEQRSYMHALHDANEMWMKGLPIFTEYNDWLLKFAPQAKANPKKTKTPKHKYPDVLPVNPKILKAYHDTDEAYFKNLLARGLEKDEAYAMYTRVSPKQPCCADSYRKYLTRAYGVTSDEIRLTQDALTHQWNTRIPFDFLRKICDVKADYDASMMNGQQASFE
jgi:hypothetical protein